jgi:hypothetical protein
MLMTQGLMRLKLPIQDLVEEILNQLPASVWQDPGIMFLDPAMAGGQFIRAIERRLLAAGHSKDNIASRVYGCEEKLIRVKYVKNWHKVLSDQLHVMEFLTHDWGDMKFDVIVGNPPYQSEKGTGTQPLWPLFVNKAADLLSDSGYMGMVIPNKWCGHTTNVIRGHIHLYGDVLKHKMLSCDIQKCSAKFPGVGGYENCFSWFMMTNSGSKAFTASTLEADYVVQSDWFDHLPLRSLNEVTSKILKKVHTAETYRFKQVSTGFVNQNSGAVVISMAQRMHYSKLNIYWDKQSKVKPTSKSTVSQVTFHKSSQKKIDAVFRSKLFEFIYAIYWNNDNFSTSFYNSLPYLDLTNLWDDSSIYKRFNLSTQEIEYIEKYLTEHVAGNS